MTKVCLRISYLRAAKSGLPRSLVYHIPSAMPRSSSSRPSSTLDMPRLDTSTSFRKEAYTALEAGDHPRWTSTTTPRRSGSTNTRRLSEGLGVSRTPIREAMTLLEQEGFVRAPCRAARIYVVRKTKREIVDDDHGLHGGSKAWRRSSSRSTHPTTTSPNCAGLMGRVSTTAPTVSAWRSIPTPTSPFHQAIIRMSGCALLAED